VTVVGTLVAWAAITALGLGLQQDADPLRVVGGQSLLYLGMAWWLGRRPEIARLLDALPRRARAGVLAGLAALVAGQLAGRNVEQFPFVRWEMYGDRLASDPSWVEFTAVDGAGRERPLEVVRAFPALNRRITSGLRGLANRIAAEPDEAARRRLEATYDATVRSLAARWTAKYPEDALRAVRVWRVTAPTAPFRGPGSLVRELAREVEVP
jgi:hypothetical protein